MKLAEKYTEEIFNKSVKLSALFYWKYELGGINIFNNTLSSGLFNSTINSPEFIPFGIGGIPI